MTREIFASKALDHPTRKMIIAGLMIAPRRRMSLAHFKKAFGLHQQSVKHHCLLLERLGFVKIRRFRKLKATYASLAWRGQLHGLVWLDAAEKRAPPP